MRNKYLRFLIFTLILGIIISGCSKKEDTVEDVVKNDVNVKKSNYILTNPEGIVSLFDLKGDLMQELNLGNKNSDYIYVLDSGNVYAEKMNKENHINNILYALDKSKGNLTILKVTDSKIEKISTKNLRDSKDIEDIYAYNGAFFYSLKSRNMKANKYTFSKPEKYKENGIIDYNATLPVAKGRELKTYIVIEDFTEDYIKGMNLDKILSDSEILEAGIKSFKRKIIEIPYNIDKWTANNENIYFFFENYMGQYRISKDQISLYYGAKNVVEAIYVGGRNKKVLTLNDLGETSTKSVVLELEHKNMQVEKSVEIEESIPLAFDVDKNNFIFGVFKNAMNSKESFARLKVLDYKNYSEIQSLPLKYIPTRVISRNNYIYLFNPHEEYFLLGVLGTSDFSKYRKNFIVDGEYLEFDNIFVLDLIYKEDYFYDANGRLVNERGQLINRDNELINEELKKVNKYGQLVNEYGRAINENGEFIDRYNNVIDLEGNIIRYVQNSDGLYRNSLGKVVSEQGQELVQDEEGHWVLPKKPEREPVEGYYDEEGNFIIDPAYLEKYPDAYEYLDIDKDN